MAPDFCQLLGNSRLGANNTVGYGSIIGADPQDVSFKPDTHSDVNIGDNNKIREYVTIHRSAAEGGSTTVGDSNFLMTGVHLAHDVQMGSHNALANNVLIAGHVKLADHVFLGGGSAFHQFIHIGKHAMISGGSLVRKDVPPFVKAAKDRGYDVITLDGPLVPHWISKVEQEVEKVFS